MPNRVLLPVKRWRQKPSECAVASVASVANFYDPTLTYTLIRKLAPAKVAKFGLYTSEQGRLLNQLNFTKVTIVTADLNFVDFSWQHLSKPALIAKLKSRKEYFKRTNTGDVFYLEDMIKWLQDKECDNQLVIDRDYPKHIRRSLNFGRPVCASFNWTSAFRHAKAPVRSNGAGDISGEAEEHAVVLRGYDKDGVYVVDSHHRLYRGRLKKYHNGYYKMSWSSFLMNSSYGDLILVW